MTTFTPSATATTVTHRRPMGVLLGSISLVLGPALIALALATLTDPWSGNQPNWTTIESRHGLLMLSFNLAAASFPFLYLSVFALAIVSRRARRLSSVGLGCSVFGLSAMFANSILSVPVVLMNGIPEHEGLTALAARLDSPPLIALLLFPLFFVGSLLQAVALWRSSAVPRWAAIGVGLGGLFPVAILTGVGALALPIAALRIAGSVPVIKNLLAMRED